MLGICQEAHQLLLSLLRTVSAWVTQAPPVTELILWLVCCCGQAEQFSYCQPWMLAWGYRKQNLLKELLAYRADILCLQARRLLSCAPAAEHAFCMECAAKGDSRGGIYGATWPHAWGVGGKPVVLQGGSRAAAGLGGLVALLHV